MNILREDWKPVLNLNAVMVGLQYLFLEPNADDPLNKGAYTGLWHRFHVSHIAASEAAEQLKLDRRRFTEDVKKSMAGGVVNGRKYDKVI